MLSWTQQKKEIMLRLTNVNLFHEVVNFAWENVTLPKEGKKKLCRTIWSDRDIDSSGELMAAL